MGKRQKNKKKSAALVSIPSLKNRRRALQRRLAAIETMLPMWPEKYEEIRKTYKQFESIAADYDGNRKARDDHIREQCKTEFLRHLRVAFQAKRNKASWLDRILSPKTLEDSDWYPKLPSDMFGWIKGYIASDWAIKWLEKGHPEAAELLETQCSDFIPRWYQRAADHYADEKNEFQKCIHQLSEHLPWLASPELNAIITSYLPEWKQSILGKLSRLSDPAKDIPDEDDDWGEGGVRGRLPSIPSLDGLSKRFEKLKQDLQDTECRILTAERENEQLLQKHGIGANVRAAAAAHFDKSRKLAKSIRTSIEAQVAMDDICPYCGCSFGDLWHADHIYPISRGGLSTLENMVAICTDCNNKKSDLTLREFIVQQSLDRNEVETRLTNLGKRF